MTQKQKALKIILMPLFIILVGSILVCLFMIYQKPRIDDNFIRSYLKKYPEATIFKPEYLDFFSPEAPFEKQSTLEYKRKYVIKGDFNKNGKEEIAIAGLLSKEADNQNNYYGFVLILEQKFFGYKTLCFEKFLKEPNSLIRNLFLFHDQKLGGQISIGFANNSGLISNFEWNKGKYELKWDSENW